MFSNRQLKVGENIKRILSEILLKHSDFAFLDQISILISKVLMTPDLSIADVYIVPMVGSKINPEELVKLLNESSSQMRYMLGKRVALRRIPSLRFKIDTSFSQAARIDELVKF